MFEVSIQLSALSFHVPKSSKNPVANFAFRMNLAPSAFKPNIDSLLEIEIEPSFYLIKYPM